jgi:hypothetical protein
MAVVMHAAVRVAVLMAAVLQSGWLSTMADMRCHTHSMRAPDLKALSAGVLQEWLAEHWAGRCQLPPAEIMQADIRQQQE